MWSDATITNAGRTLIAQWTSGTTLTITGAKLGTGTVAAAQLATQTGVTNYAADASISANSIIDDGAKLTVHVTPGTTGYTCRQVGIYGKLDGGTETLIAIYQDETGFEVPTSAEMPEFLYDFYAIIAMDITGTLNVTISSNVYMDKSVYDADGDGVVDKAAGLTDTAQNTLADSIFELIKNTAWGSESDE